MKTEAAVLSDDDSITLKPIFSYNCCPAMLFLCTCTYTCSTSVTQESDQEEALVFLNSQMLWLILPWDLADSIAKCNMLLAIPCRRADLTTHKFAI